MHAWYAQNRELARISPGGGGCTGNRFRGQRQYSDRSGIAGALFCFVASDGEPYVFWTDRRASVGAQANIYAGKGPAASASLLRQWACCLKPVG
jgi:hypothetical protein